MSETNTQPTGSRLADGPAIECPYTFTMELVPTSAGSATDVASASGELDLELGPPLHVESIDGDLGDLVEETWVMGLLADELPLGSVPLRVSVQPVWRQEPLVDQLRVEVLVRTPDGGEARSKRDFAWGRWSRRALGEVHRLREQKLLADDAHALAVVYARPRPDPSHPSSLAPSPGFRVPPLQEPEVSDQTLEELGVRALGEGGFDPLRPVLVNARMLQEILELTERCGVNETGGGTLGKIVRLPEPLPGTRTRLVTLLTASLADERHEGRPGEFRFSPEALAQADEIARLRSLGERVVTAFHSHGWGTSCGNCNESEGCTLPQCTEVSLDDYQVLESMLPCKSTLMPIAGRKLGAVGRRPVLEIHAWDRGRVRPIRWTRYAD
jgi:hypothetical protein